MLARAIEEQGLPTASIALIKEHAQRVKPPRALWVPFPFGFALGKAGDPAFQHRVLKATLDLFEQPSGPVLAEFNEEIDAPPTLLQASAAQTWNTNRDADAADEITTLRGYYERWVGEHDDRTMVGVSGVPQRRFRGLVRFLQSVASGETPEYEEVPEGMALPRFTRLAADDLKAFYVEARMCQRPGQEHNDLHRWFWSETAAGHLLAQVAERFKADGDDRVAQGIAR